MSKLLQETKLTCHVQIWFWYKESHYHVESIYDRFCCFVWIFHVYVSQKTQKYHTLGIHLLTFFLSAIGSVVRSEHRLPMANLPVIIKHRQQQEGFAYSFNRSRDQQD